MKIKSRYMPMAGDLSGLGDSFARLGKYVGGGHLPAIPKSDEQIEKEESHRSINVMAKIALASTADEFHKRLSSQIKTFDETLDPEHEVGVKLVTFGQAMTFHVTSLGYHNPSLIFFHGRTPDGDRIQLIQNVSQISFVLIALPRLDPDQPRKPFGFEQGVAGDAPPLE